ncbi:MAG: NTP transferase domain-containing protein [Spirochaetaceae bacterium]
MESNSSIDCIMPAAGLSSRMGVWKPLLPYRGTTLVEKSVSRALEFCSRVILVTGHRGDELEELFDKRSEDHRGYPEEPRVVCVRNRDYGRGMFSSIQTGAGAVEAPLFFIALADMPELPLEVYQLLFRHIVETDTAEGNPSLSPLEVVRPLYRGNPAHPVLCRRRVAETILSEPPESNMQNVMKHRRLLEIEVDRPECLYDVDTGEDLLE